MNNSRSEKGLLDFYRQQYEQLYATDKRIGSFDRWIRDQYNSTLKRLKRQSKKAEVDDKYSDELNRVRRGQYVELDVVKRNRTRAVKRLDTLVNIEEEKIFSSGYKSTKYSSTSRKKNEEYNNSLDYFLTSTSVSDKTKEYIQELKDGRVKDKKVFYDFLNTMKKTYGNRLDDYYKQSLEDYIHKITSNEQAELEQMDANYIKKNVTLFKLKNPRKYNLTYSEENNLMREITKYGLSDSERDNIGRRAYRRMQNNKHFRLTLEEADRLGISEEEMKALDEIKVK